MSTIIHIVWTAIDPPRDLLHHGVTYASTVALTKCGLPCHQGRPCDVHAETAYDDRRDYYLCEDCFKGETVHPLGTQRALGTAGDIGAVLAGLGTRRKPT
jgi:hypothetical protein